MKNDLDSTHYILNPHLDGVGPVKEPKHQSKVDIGCLYRASISMGMKPAASIEPQPAIFVYDHSHDLVSNPKYRKYVVIIGIIVVSILSMVLFINK